MNGIAVLCVIAQLTHQGSTSSETQEACEDIDSDERCSKICLANGKVTEGRHVKETIYFTCDPGRQHVGATNATCRANGEWSNEKPTCAYIYRCPYLTPPNAGSITYKDGDKHKEIGGQAEFSCNKGHKIVGAKTLTCLKGGKWDHDRPGCINKMCPAFPYISYGKITKLDVVEGGTVQFQCDTGYKMEGKSSLTCKGDRTWDGIAPKCQATSCPHVYTFRHGSVSQTKNHQGAEIEFTCHPGYKLIGSPSIRCTESRKWSGAVPKCTYSRCKWQPIQRFGTITRSGEGDWTKNMQIHCNEGYKANKPTTLHCTGTSWSSGIPTCRPNMCKTIYTQYKGTIINYSKRPGSTYTLKCDGGYKLRDPNLSTRTCNPDTLKWSASPACTKDGSVTTRTRYCTAIVDLGNGKCVGSRQPGGVVKCTCDPGYKLSGHDTLKCHAEKWDKPLPRCRAAFCPFLPLLYGGKTEGENNYPGSKIKYSCFDGYTLKGASVLTCQENGKWSHTPPICKETRCNNLLNIGHGDLSGTGDTVGATRSIMCHKGFKLSGSSKVTCENAKWLPAIPSCIRNACKPRYFMNNGVIEGDDFTVGAILKIKCNPEYVPDGPTEITCEKRQDSFQWSANPRCKRVICPSIGAISNGKISSYSNLPGSTTVISCDSRFKLSGPETLVCSSDGQWNNPIPKCVALTQCKSICLGHGYVDYTSKMVGATMTFKCDGSHRLVGSESVTCQANGEWSPEIPTCVEW